MSNAGGWGQGPGGGSDRGAGWNDYSSASPEIPPQEVQSDPSLPMRNSIPDDVPPGLPGVPEGERVEGVAPPGTGRMTKKVNPAAAVGLVVAFVFVGMFLPPIFMIPVVVGMIITYIRSPKMEMSPELVARSESAHRAWDQYERIKRRDAQRDFLDGRE